MRSKDIHALLDRYADLYNQPTFLADDPIGLPAAFEELQDKEIVAFWVAMLAWGQRKTILQKGLELIELMDGQPYQFVINHQASDLERFRDWKHRTFNYTDTCYFLRWLQQYYRKHDSLEAAFSQHLCAKDEDITPALVGFHSAFFALPEAPHRTRKHLATPASKSRCKRLCMFLRWMVRRDERGVDFGLWTQISPAQLCLPLDVHVERVARELGLLSRKQADWQAVQELTNRLRIFDPKDPARYDFALFGLGVHGVSIGDLIE